MRRHVSVQNKYMKKKEKIKRRKEETEGNCARTGRDKENFKKCVVDTNIHTHREREGEREREREKVVNVNLG